jgi:hypothetical protein
MPEIPINPLDLPTEAEPLDETITYTGTISRIVNPDGVDKNGNAFFGISVEITDPEEVQGRKIGDNYIQLPLSVTPTMDGKARKRAMESGIRLGRLCRSAKFEPGNRTWDTDELVGLAIRFLVRNDEYQGRMVPKISDYTF